MAGPRSLGRVATRRLAAGRFGRGLLLIWLATAALLFSPLCDGQAQDDEAVVAQGLAAFDGGDFTGAFEAWAPLAARGHADAQVLVAGLYLTGRGVDHASATTAANYYRKAARQGHAVAQLNLGDLYSRGLGVPRDLAQAYRWLALAANQGRHWAAVRRDETATSMTPTELAEAQRLLANGTGN